MDWWALKRSIDTELHMETGFYQKKRITTFSSNSLNGETTSSNIYNNHNEKKDNLTNHIKESQLKHWKMT